MVVSAALTVPATASLVQIAAFTMPPKPKLFVSWSVMTYTALAWILTSRTYFSFSHTKEIEIWPNRNMFGSDWPNDQEDHTGLIIQPTASGPKNGYPWIPVNKIVPAGGQLTLSVVNFFAAFDALFYFHFEEPK